MFADLKCGVALCTYNGEKYIGEQLDSILEQTMPIDEIVICDDKSSDNTITIIEQKLRDWKGDKTIVVNKSNIGFRKNFQKAISLCKSDIIFLSDQDDVWAKEKIERVMEMFHGDDRVMMVFHDAEAVDENLNIIMPSFWRSLHFDAERLQLDGYRRLAESNIVQGAACAFRKNIVKGAMPFPDGVMHDEWLALLAVLRGEIIPLPQCLVKYRQTGNNMVGSGQASDALKCKAWISGVEEKVQIYVEAMESKILTLDSFLRQPRIDEFSQSDYFRQVRDFLKLRLGYIKKRNYGIVFLFWKYIHFHTSAKWAMIRWMQDILAALCWKNRA